MTCFGSDQTRLAPQGDPVMPLTHADRVEAVTHAEAL